MADNNRLVEYIKEVFKWFSDERQELEDIWLSAYDAFRGEYNAANLKRWLKAEGTDWRSRVFVRLTKLKIVSAVSQINDVYFQGGKIPFSISPTPIAQDMTGMVLPPDVAEMRARAMQTKIEDYLAETNARKRLQMAILELAIYGMSWLHTPVMQPNTKLRYRFQVPRLAALSDMMIGTNLAQKYGRHVPAPETTFVPAVQHPNLWDMFWDMESEDPVEGHAIIHRVMMSPGMLRDLARMPGFDSGAIDQAIADYQGVKSSAEPSEGPAREKRGKKVRAIPVYHYCGKVEKRYLDDEDSALYKGMEDGKEAEVKVIVAGDKVIFKPVRSPYPAEMRPFTVAFWEEIPHESQGVGVAENLRDSQAMVNGAARLFIDNKSLSGNILMAMQPRALAPGQSRTLYPGKLFELAEGVQDARAALTFFSPPDIGAGILEMINLFERFADEESNLPKLLEGEKSVGDPKTAYAFSKLVENANKALGEVIKHIDAGHTEPMVQGLYHWLMATDPDESIKGDYTCKANGFTVYSDRVVQGQNLQNFLTFMLSNQFTSEFPNIEFFLTEIAKTRNIDPEKALLRAEQIMATRMQKAQAMMQSRLPPPAPNGIIPGQEGMP